MQALLLGLAKSMYYIFKQLGDGRKKNTNQGDTI